MTSPLHPASDAAGRLGIPSTPAGLEPSGNPGSRSGASAASSRSATHTGAPHTISIQTVVVDGRLDALAASGLRSEVSRLLESGVSRIVVDLTNVTFVDSAGLAALAGGMKHARAAGGDLRIARSPHADAARIFRLTRFDQIFRMADSVDTLVASW